jgi:ribonuclease HI
MLELTFYTDGACSGNPGPGAWAIITIISPNEKFPQGWVLEKKGFSQHTTNNKMELQACIEALKLTCYLHEKKSPVLKTEILADSQYVLKGMNIWVHNWKKTQFKTAQGKPVKNQDQWLEIDALREKADRLLKGRLLTTHVKGHNGDPGNERVDELCQKTSKGIDITCYKGTLSQYPYLTL